MGIPGPMEWFARLGLLARGVVYATVGVLALKLALGNGPAANAPDQVGAMATLSHQSFGEVLLIVVAAGLFAYASWRLWRACTGRDEGVKERASGVVSGIGYGILCVAAIKILIDAGRTQSDPDQATGTVFDLPYGRYVIAVVGAIVVLEGLAQLWTGVRQKFCENAKTEQMGRYTRKAYGWVGTLGYCARFVVFGLIGYFLLKAAIDAEPDEAIALDGALAKVAHQDFGPLLLGLVSAGLLAFALFCFAEMRYRRV